MKSIFIKYMISIAVITLVALVYVHQQIELVKLGYAVDYKEKNLVDMLDHKENLEYNINNLEAPSRLEKVLVSKRVDVAFPKRNQIVRVRKTSAGAKSVSLRSAAMERKATRFNLIYELFGLRAEAHAREK